MSVFDAMESERNALDSSGIQQQREKRKSQLMVLFCNSSYPVILLLILCWCLWAEKAASCGKAR